jgi:hypothetical protein
MMTHNIKHIHPFPARMAPDIALEHVRDLPENALVADLMCGSGTVLRVAAESGHRCIGFDLDPLAVLMSRVWTTPIDVDVVREASADLIKASKRIQGEPLLPWVDGCPETSAFVERWFEPPQQRPIRRLAYLLAPRMGPISDVLRLALSRTIVTKERGASIARDTSHSRPHTWFVGNTYDVWKGFEIAADRLLQRLRPEHLKANVVVNQGDARNVSAVPSGIVDAIISSPPYLNAIDYLRGHRLALVWLGYGLRELRSIRSVSIGTEKAARTETSDLIAEWLRAASDQSGQLPLREQGMLQRYAEDVTTMVGEAKRILKPDGRMTLVIGNSRLLDVFIENSKIIELAARATGFHVLKSTTRGLLTANRYLPIAGNTNPSALDKRMKEEVILTFGA